MALSITVHRGTQTIGGSCIEIENGSSERLVLDAGRPLDAPRNAKDLLPGTLDRTAPANVLFSHGHMDHWGLISELPEHWSIWSGERSAEMMRLTSELFDTPIERPFATWHSRSEPFNIGTFRITPYLTDHSAPDAYMLLIEGDGQRVLYTGDFRAHGRKAALVEAMIAKPPPDIDVLLMEGTNLGSDKPVFTEKALEAKFVALARQTARHVFVQWSAQNLDRTVTLYRAALQTDRKLVVDLYTADVLCRLAPGTGIPQPGTHEALQVVITPGLKGKYLKQGRSEFVKRMAETGFGTSRRRLIGARAIIMLRDSMIWDFESDGLKFQEGDCYAFSNWSGYLDPEDPRSGWARAAAAGARTERLHTSGHASSADLSRFAAAIAPKALVPVHGIMWDNPEIDLPPIQRLDDGETWTIPVRS